MFIVVLKKNSLKFAKNIWEEYIYKLGWKWPKIKSVQRLSMEYCKSSRGGDQLLFEGFRYQVNRRGNNGKVFWRCHNRNCPGRIVVEHETVGSKTQHSHQPDNNSDNVKNLISTLRTQCQESVDTIPKLYNDMLVTICSYLTSMSTPLCLWIMCYYKVL